MTTKDQAIAQAFKLWADRQRNWTDTLRAEAWAAFQEGYWSAQPPAPDCRTCEHRDGTFCGNRIHRGIRCTNGDKYQPAPSVVLWRTE